ncbi:MAG: 5-formyltetrahydrofolate cyclo-ligase [Oxalobacteraceae bacterium]|jgi:5-formyltetrahydrofolate cyclo-ligase|nr:5-formyltetrahydrofolate cyclo-ligase [Oxalobacteraceae bacterium]
MQTPINKVELRQQLIAARRSMSELEKSQADARILQRLSDWLTKYQPASLGAYIAMSGEPELLSLYESLDSRGITLAMPVVVEKNQPLIYVRWLPGESLKRDASGTMAPALHEQIIQPEVVLAPCLGFNDEGFRLGYGGGYFDRTLAQSPRPTAVGIAYAVTRRQFATEAHDIALDYIITD